MARRVLTPARASRASERALLGAHAYGHSREPSFHDHQNALRPLESRAENLPQSRSNPPSKYALLPSVHGRPGDHGTARYLSTFHGERSRCSQGAVDPKWGCFTGNISLALAAILQQGPPRVEIRRGLTWRLSRPAFPVKGLGGIHNGPVPVYSAEQEVTPTVP